MAAGVERAKWPYDIEWRIWIVRNSWDARIGKKIRKWMRKKRYVEVEPADWLDDLERMWLWKGQMREILKIKKNDYGQDWMRNKRRLQMRPRRIGMSTNDRGFRRGQDFLGEIGTESDRGFVGLWKNMRSAVRCETVDGCKTAKVWEGRETDESEDGTTLAADEISGPKSWRTMCYEVEYTMLYRIPILCKTFITRPGATPPGHSKRNMMFAYNNVNAN